MTTISKPVAIIPPPLEFGDRLTRAEFEQRYELMPAHIKAELIEGVVYMASPVRANSHGVPTALIVGWLTTYWAATPGTNVADNTTVRLDLDNEVQPDALLRIDDAHGGRSRISPDDYLEGPPELVVEVAASSAAYDLYDKLHVYRRNGIAEYLVWSMYPRRFDWFRLQDGLYVPLQPDANGVIASIVFPGLHLDVQALLDENVAAVVARAQIGIASEEHTAFVNALTARATQH